MHDLQYLVSLHSLDAIKLS